MQESGMDSIRLPVVHARCVRPATIFVWACESGCCEDGCESAVIYFHALEHYMDIRLDSRHDWYLERYLRGKRMPLFLRRVSMGA
jgi:hypothetical protein